MAIGNRVGVLSSRCGFLLQDHLLFEFVFLLHFLALSIMNSSLVCVFLRGRMALLMCFCKEFKVVWILKECD